MHFLILGCEDAALIDEVQPSWTQINSADEILYNILSNFDEFWVSFSCSEQRNNGLVPAHNGGTYWYTYYDNVRPLRICILVDLNLIQI